MGSVVAIDDNGIDNNLTEDSSEIDLEIIDESNKLSEYNDNSVISAPQTVVVDGTGGNHNEMNEHSIRDAINSANAGDKIIISGESYVHTHVKIDKPLTITSNVGTKLSSCSSNAFSGHQGVFYITSQASGTIIEGFNFNNDDGVLSDSEGYAILIDGASNVIIRNCNFSTNKVGDGIRMENAINGIVQNVAVSNTENGIKIKNSQNIVVKDSTVTSSNYGIYDIDSTKTTITSNNIKNNMIAGVEIAGTSQNSMILSNNITNNKYGVELTSSKNINILSNYLAFNSEFGVYVDCQVEKIKINGNFFNKNTKGEVYNSKAVNNVWVPGGEKLEEVNNNYMISLNNERPINRAGLGGVFLGYVFEIGENVACPIIYFTYNQNEETWAISGNYELQLSNITQVKRGIYSISIVDEKGNVATDLSSVPVTFYLNKEGLSATPKEGDTYRTVMMQNGTATVRFYMDEFKESGNVITAVVPTPGSNIDDKVSKKFAVSDESIPGIPVNTTLTVTSLNTYPNSNQEIVATLNDVNGKVVVGEPLIFNINSKTYTINTDSNGQVKLKINEPKEGTYIVKVTYKGDDVEYYGSSAQGTVVVKNNAAAKKTKIISSNFNMIPKMAEYYSITLKDGNNNVLANQKVTFKVNGKTYSAKSNSKGVAKVKLKFNKKKTYKINIIYKGNGKYDAASKTNKIKVKYSSKKAKLTAPNVSILPKKAIKYTVSLKDENGKGISKQRITVKINGKNYNKKTNKKGQVVINVKFSKKKTYKVTASYKGSRIYKKASAKGQIIVDEIDTVTTAPSLSAFTKESKTYTATLKTKAGKAVSNQKLTFNVDGKTYTQTTDANGQASITLQFNNENVYLVKVTFAATGIYKASSASGRITVSKLPTQLQSNDRTFPVNSSQSYQVTLKEQSGNPLANQPITFSINGSTYSKSTDVNGHASVNFTDLPLGCHDILIQFAGNDLYKAVSKTNKITILNKTDVIFIDGGLSNTDIQNLLGSSVDGDNIEFLGDSYSDISLDINKSLRITSSNNSILNAKANNPVFKISANNVSISGFSFKGNSNDALVIENACNISVFDNVISDVLDESKIESYLSGNVNLPGYGISISNSSFVKISKNSIDLFESGIFAQMSNNLIIANNTLHENNYGIKYGFGVKNTKIISNEITRCIGLYTMVEVEGPTGYGIYLNNSAVNVTIFQNHIYLNHMGISLDANYSTGIVITENLITDNVLEGIRFNAGYDLAENAIAPHVTDNAIYRNARGPSKMILGELSANPAGIYGRGLYNDSAKLQLEANWYGVNSIITWNDENGTVGYGTMCPRINTSAIKFNNVDFDGENYTIEFYKNDVLASNLPTFDLFATLNWGTDKAVEINFNVVNGVGTFRFNSSDYNSTNNTISITVATLVNSTSRVPRIIYVYEAPDN